MRLMICIAVLLLACSMATVEGWFRGGRRNIRIRTGTPPFNPDTRRHWQRHKRSDYLSELCEFMTYDADENGEVILGEFRDVYGENETAFDLFTNLDSDGSGAIEEAEFYRQAPSFIDECADIAADDEK